MHPVDLRSDTVTKPVPAMLEAMFRAEVGDDVYGEDATVNALETRVAELLGKEAALFVPSGTMANQLALNVLAPPGTSVIAEQDSHVFIYEVGAAAVLSGVQFDIIPWDEGISPEAIERRFRPEGLHFAHSGVVVVENTHNRGFGRALGPAALRPIVNTARRLGMKLHCDGARLWNAAVATGATERELVEGFDTVSVCFSKGLGAPIGSALAGSRDLIERARKIRKRWGGGMRQAGYLAAAALWAIDHHRARLADDHRRVAMFHDGIEALIKAGKPLTCQRLDRPSNILYFDLTNGESAEFTRRARERGVLLSDIGRGRVRIVTHLHVTDACVERGLEAIRASFR